MGLRRMIRIRKKRVEAEKRERERERRQKSFAPRPMMRALRGHSLVRRLTSGGGKETRGASRNVVVGGGGERVRMSSASAQQQEASASVPESLVTKGLVDVRKRVEEAAKKSGNKPPRLVAVGKTKPLEMVMDAYKAGHRYFGENYVQEVIEKAGKAPEDIKWHFIGHLQSNKAKALLEGVPNLSMLETVDTAKLADRLNRLCGELERTLKVLVQVNTSGEESKHGVEPEEATKLAAHIVSNCPALKFAGFMTIGMPDYTSRPENFDCLKECRRKAAEELNIDEAEIELSMGMSGDFEAAIEMGSTNIRVGSTIFGARIYNK